MSRFIHQNPDWPNFDWDLRSFLPSLLEVKNMQGKITGRMERLGFNLKSEATLEATTLDVLKTSEIEGEVLNLDQVRSSVARKLGIDIANTVQSDRHVDGVVEMLLDATLNANDALTEDRLFGWHSALFPSGRSGMHKIVTGNWRDDTKGPMQVVSGPMGMERVHFEAPNADLLPNEMFHFLDWFNNNNHMDSVIKAAVAHLWFVTIHPFDDGNGRIARALTDLLLARSDRSNLRFYSMSSQIRLERKEYYSQLEKAQKGDLNITEWMLWFMDCLLKALQASDAILNKTLFKADFWTKHSNTLLNERQIKLLNKLLDGFDGKLSSSKWAKIAKCSKDTAVRDINDLLNKNVLIREEAGGRSTHYELAQL